LKQIYKIKAFQNKHPDKTLEHISVMNKAICLHILFNIVKIIHNAFFTQKKDAYSQINEAYN